MYSQVENFPRASYLALCFPPIHSPYLWSGSQHYTVGKYVADHEYSPSGVSNPIGTAVLLFRMSQRDLIVLKAEKV